ncbi:MAG: hypothetical protein BWX84_00777 [Verrucomicrobia bacterium ADurb.Bin118]|nr:MAG: hypothetical protein BWX84_00777 [Verrucomicrobia bacterium ADurb.Bin118]
MVGPGTNRPPSAGRLRHAVEREGFDGIGRAGEIEVHDRRGAVQRQGRLGIDIGIRRALTQLQGGPAGHRDIARAQAAIHANVGDARGDQGAPRVGIVTTQHKHRSGVHRYSQGERTRARNWARNLEGARPGVPGVGAEGGAIDQGNALVRIQRHVVASRFTDLCAVHDRDGVRGGRRRHRAKAGVVGRESGVANRVQSFRHHQLVERMLHIVSAQLAGTSFGEDSGAGDGAVIPDKENGAVGRQVQCASPRADGHRFVGLDEVAPDIRCGVAQRRIVVEGDRIRTSQPAGVGNGNRSIVNGQLIQDGARLQGRRPRAHFNHRIHVIDFAVPSGVVVVRPERQNASIADKLGTGHSGQRTNGFIVTLEVEGAFGANFNGGLVRDAVSVPQLQGAVANFGRPAVRVVTPQIQCARAVVNQAGRAVQYGVDRRHHSYLRPFGVAEVDRSAAQSDVAVFEEDEICGLRATDGNREGAIPIVAGGEHGGRTRRPSNDGASAVRVRVPRVSHPPSAFSRAAPIVGGPLRSAVHVPVEHGTIIIQKGDDGRIRIAQEIGAAFRQTENHGFRGFADIVVNRGDDDVGARHSRLEDKRTGHRNRVIHVAGCRAAQGEIHH